MANTKVQSEQIEDGAITAAKIADGAIVASEVADNAITTAKINADAVTGAKIADDAINSEHYTDGSIDTAHIADANITTAKIAGDAVTGAKIADDAINSEHYTDGSIDTAHIADDQVTQAKMANDSVGADELASNAVVTASIVDANVTTAKIADDAVTSAKLDTNIDIAGTFDVTGATTLDSTLGIGVASPEGLFEIEDGGTSKDILQKITLDDDNLYGLVIGNDSFSTTLADGFAVTVGNSGLVGLQARGSGSQLQFRTANTERLLIDAAGKVGIGTTSPDYPVEIEASNLSSGLPQLTVKGKDNDLTGIGLVAYGSNASHRNWGIAANQTAAGAFNIGYTANSTNAPSTGNITSAFFIDSSGNVGIGNTNPGDYSADANNLVVGSLTGNNGITILSTPSAGYGSIYFADATTNNKVYAGYIRYQQDNSIMTFGINETERMRIQLGGGISFNGDSATANALDDYEEGTFQPTPSISGASGAIAFKSAADTLSYTKIGDLVHIQGYLEVDSNTVNGGRLNLGNLPFTSVDSAEASGYSLFTCQLSSGSGSQASGFFASIGEGLTVLQVQTYTGVGTSNDSAVTMVANSFLFIQGQYKSA